MFKKYKNYALTDIDIPVIYQEHIYDFLDHEINIKDHGEIYNRIYFSKFKGQRVEYQLQKKEYIFEIVSNSRGKVGFKNLFKTGKVVYGRM